MATFLRRLLYWIRRRQLEADLAAEMEFHRAARQAALERDGLPPQEAAALSRRAMGNVTLAREDARGVWIWSWLESAWQDVRHTARLVRRQPAFAAAVVAIVALGCGATICAFALLDGLVVKSLPVERPDRLVWFSQPSFSYPQFSEVRARVPVFDGLFAWNVDRVHVDWSGSAGELVPADLLETSDEFFSVLGVGTVAGRRFGAGDTTAAVISHAAWRQHFGSDPSVVGRSIRIDRELFTVVGVAPAGFFGVAPGLAPEIIVPLASRNAPPQFASTTSSWLHMMGRLKDGVTLEQADAALQVAWPAIMEATTETGIPADRRARFLARKTALMPGHAGFSRVRNQFGDPLWLLMYLVTLLLAVACASVGNLLLARGLARRKELSVRLAIGASRARVFRQLFVEALLLTVCGAVVGLVIASWTGGLLVGLLRTTRSLLVLDTSIGWRLAAFTFALVLIVTPISTLLPALLATRGHITTGLKEGAEPGAALLRRWPLGKMLVAVQVALALILLAGAAMFGRSLARVLAQDSGIDASRVLVVSPDAVAAGYEGAALTEFHARLLERLGDVPGVESAAMSWFPPISYPSGGWTQGITIDGNARTTDDSRKVNLNGISPRYFETVGMALRRGRDLSDRDTASAPRVAVVNETLARQFFAGEDPIGHRITISRDASRQNILIVGVVADARFRRLQEPTRSVVYLPIAQLADMLDDRNLTVQIRAASTSPVAAAVRQQLRVVDSRVPVQVESVTNRIRESTINERLMAALSAVLGGAALLLACAGLYGLLASAVSRHRHEIGLRIALGARPQAVMWMVQRESLVLAAIGIAVGLGGTLALGRFVRTLLFQVTPTDPVALAAASAVMLLVAAGAAFLPAHRAARVDPVVALRSDT